MILVLSLTFSYYSLTVDYRSSGPMSYGFASLDTSQMLDTETVCSVDNSSDSGSGPPSLQHEFDSIQTVERSAETDTLKHTNQATSPQSEASPILPTAPSGLYFNLDHSFLKCAIHFLQSDELQLKMKKDQLIPYTKSFHFKIMMTTMRMKLPVILFQIIK